MEVGHRRGVENGQLHMPRPRSAPRCRRTIGRDNGALAVWGDGVTNGVGYFVYVFHDLANLCIGSDEPKNGPEAPSRPPSTPASTKFHKVTNFLNSRR